MHLADKYDDYYPDLQPRLDKSVVVAGAILHDIGKSREYREEPTGAVYTAEGALIGHMLQGRDIVREFAADRKLRPRKPCCGWSTSSSPTKAGPNGARRKCP